MPPDSQISVLLIDNDSEQTAKPVFDLQEISHFCFFYHCEPRRGVSRARNMGIEKMLADDGDMILFVDDDMRLPPEYLRILVSEMQKRNADAVRGKMKLVYEEGQVRPSCKASLFARCDILPTNGSLVAASILKDYNLRLDERVMFGYEDADFFCRAHLRGARLFLLESPYFFGPSQDRRKGGVKILYGGETGAHGNKKMSQWLASWCGLCFTARHSIDIANYCELYFVAYFATKEGKKKSKE